MAYPIASMADGSVLFSDGTKRRKPQYSPAKGYGSYDDGFAFKGPGKGWEAVDTDYPYKIAASGYGSQFQNDLSRYSRRKRYDSKKPDDRRSRNYWKKRGIIRRGIWSYVGNKRFRSTSDARKYMEKQRRENIFSSLMSKNPFSPRKAYAAESPALNFTPANFDQTVEERSMPEKRGAFGTILRRMGVPEFGLSEILGGEMRSYRESDNRYKLPSKIVEPANLYAKYNPATFITGATVRGADRAAGNWLNTPVVVKGGRSQSSVAPEGSFTAPKQSAAPEGPQFTPAENVPQTIGDYIWNPESLQWEKKTESGTISAVDDMRAKMKDILGEQGAEDFYALLDENKGQAITSQEEMRDAIINQLEAQRDYLLEQYKNLKGDARTRAENQIKELNDQLDLYKNQGAEAKEEIRRGYGELIRQAAKGKKMRDLQRRNMFSSLGTADSSAFIESQTAADQAFGSSLVNTRRDEQKRIADIERDISTLDTWTKQSVNDINNKLNAYINEINKAEVLTDADKEKLTQEAMAQAQAMIGQIQNEYQTQMYNLSLNRQALMAQLMPNLLQAQQLAEQLKALRQGGWASGDEQPRWQGYVPPAQQQEGMPTYTWQDIVEGNKKKKDMSLYEKILRSLTG